MLQASRRQLQSLVTNSKEGPNFGRAPSGRPAKLLLLVREHVQIYTTVMTLQSFMLPATTAAVSEGLWLANEAASADIVRECLPGLS